MVLKNHECQGASKICFLDQGGKNVEGSDRLDNLRFTRELVSPAIINHYQHNGEVHFVLLGAASPMPTVHLQLLWPVSILH